MPKLLLIALPLAALAFLTGRTLNTPQAPAGTPQDTPPVSTETLQPAPTPPTTPPAAAPTLDEVLAARGPTAVTLLARFAPAATAADIAHLFDTADTAGSTPEFRYPNAWWHLLGRTWFRLDPETAAARATEPALNNHRRQQLLAAWAATDPAAALAAAAAHGKSTLNRLLASVSRSNPDTFADLAAPYISPDEVRDMLLRSDAATDRDPAAALANALDIGSPSKREHAVTTLLRGAAERDPRQALTLAQEIDDPALRDRAVVAIAWSLASSWNDPDLFRSVFPTVAPSRERASIAISAARKWGAEDPDGALAWTRANLAGPERDAVVAAVIHASQSDNPTAILDYLDEHGWDVDLQNATQGNRVRSPNGGGGGNSWGAESFRHLLSGALHHLAEDDPHHALRRVADIPDQDLREDIVKSLASNWMGDDPQAATAWLATVPAGYTDTALPRAAAQKVEHWVAADPDAARSILTSTDFANPAMYNALLTAAITGDLANPERSGATRAWAQGLPDETRAEIATDVTTKLARENPATAAQLALDLGIEHQTKYGISNIAARFINTDPQGAAGWLAGLPPGADAHHAFHSFAEDWTGDQPAEASSWVGSLPGGDRKDHAVTGLVSALMNPEGDAVPDYGAAVHWSASITDDGTRQENLRKVAQRWANHDAAGLADFLESSPDLPPATHQAILDAID